jgi:hypothetical protein
MARVSVGLEIQAGHLAPPNSSQEQRVGWFSLDAYPNLAARYTWAAGQPRAAVPHERWWCPKAEGRRNKAGRLPPSRFKVKSSGQECPLHTIKVKSSGRGRPLYTCYVPSLHPAKYSSCSGVSRSILIAIDSSFNLATRLSRSSGTR